MKIDQAWFKQAIAAAGLSLRRLAPLLTGVGGQPLDPAAVSRLLSGKREMRFEEARQLAEALGVSPVEVLIRAGAITAREVAAWAKGRER